MQTISPDAQRAASHTTLFEKIADHHRIVLGVIVVLFVCMGLCYIAFVPPVEGPDESGHLLYIHHILETGNLPPLLTRETMKDLPEPYYMWNTHTHHPPLYYWLGAALTSWTQRDDIAAYYVPNKTLFTRTQTPGNINLWLHPVTPTGDTYLFILTLRLASLFMGTLTLLLVYRGAWLFSQDRIFSLLVTTVPLGIPSFIFASASVGNDSLLILFFTAGFVWLVQQWYAPGFALRDYLIVTALLTVTILTKLSGITLAIILYGSLLAGWMLRRPASPSARQIIVFIMVTGIATALLTGGWFLRLWSLSGHPLATPVVQDLWGRPTALTLPELSADLLQIWRTLWVSFGYSQYPVQLPAAYYSYAALYSIIGIGSALLLTDRKQRGLIGYLTASIGLVLAFLLYGNTQINIAFGRLLLPALLPFAVVVMAGWWRIRRVAAVALVIVLVVISGIVAAITLPAIYPSVQPVKTIPPDAIAINADSDQLPQPMHLSFVDARLSFTPALMVNLYVPGTFPPDVFTTFIVNDARTNQTLTYIETVPGMVDWSTMSSDEYYRARVRIPLPPDAAMTAPDDAAPLRVVLGIGFVEMETGQSLATAVIEQPSTE